MPEKINWNAMLVLVGILEFLHGILIYFLLSPMRDLKKQVTTLTNAGFQAAIAELKERVNKIANDYVPTETLRRIDRKRSLQVGGINGRVEILLQRTARLRNSAQEAEYMTAIRAAEQAEDEAEI